MELKENDIEEYENVMEELESKCFKDTLDLIMFLEC